MKLILLGAPGAGKGTQAEIISKKLNIPTISTGNILRAAVKDGTPMGLKAKSFMDAGALVPDEVILGIIKERLTASDCANGFILDGVPRTIAQAEALEQLGIEIDKVVNLLVEDSTIEARMAGRRVCAKCGASYHIKNKPSKVEGVCDRCGAEFPRTVDLDLHADITADAQDDDPEVFTLDGDWLDVDEVLSTCFILSMDTKCLCRPDCAGLCDRCGANLNLGPCRCQKPRDPRMAVLEQLLDNKTDEEEEAAHNSD